MLMFSPRLKIKMYKRKISLGLAGLFAGLTLLASVSPVFASGALNTMSATLGSSAASASTTYSVAFKTAGTTAINSVSVQACSNASGTCGATPTGFSASSSTLSATQSGFSTASGSAATGLSGAWTVNTATAGTLKGTATTTSATTTSTLYGIQWAAVTNPSATNSTYYLWITTYSDTGYATPIDTGVAAVSTAGQVTVNATVNQVLTFTLATQTVTLSGISPTLTGSGTSTMAAATNAGSGYVITVSGSTLSGPTTITALSSPTASSAGTKQFGINLKANTAPSVGSDPSGGSGAAAAGYSTANSFKFATGDTVASAAGGTNTTTYTVSYIANVDYTAPAGSYTTTLTYTCTPTF